MVPSTFSSRFLANMNIVLLPFCPSVLLYFCPFFPSVLLIFDLLSFCPSSFWPFVLLSFCPSNFWPFVLLSFLIFVLLSFCPFVLLPFCPFSSGHLPSSSSLMSLAAWMPSSLRFFSICLLRALDARSSALMAQPMMTAWRGPRATVLKEGRPIGDREIKGMNCKWPIGGREKEKRRNVSDQ